MYKIDKISDSLTPTAPLTPRVHVRHIVRERKSDLESERSNI
jgi:hypothetical protein